MVVCIIRIVLTGIIFRNNGIRCQIKEETGIFPYQAADHLIQMIFCDDLTDHNECSDSKTGTPVSFYLRHRNLSIRKIFQEASSFRKALSMDERVSEICNSQSIGAAIENMTLEAAAQGLGSLWICNSFFAQKELSDWAGGELYAVLAVGYADEAPEARLRKRTEDVIEWRV